MEIGLFVENIQRQLEAAADAGGEEARVLAERLLAPLESAIRLSIQDALAAAAEEITLELAPGSVELRLRGRDPEFVVTLPALESPPDDQDGSADDRSIGFAGPAMGSAAGGGRGARGEWDEGGMARINLRLPEQLKARVETAAAGEGVSVNSWLVRAAGSKLERGGVGGRPESGALRGRQRYKGWAR
jgi:hypothetical protein